MLRREQKEIRTVLEAAPGRFADPQAAASRLYRLLRTGAGEEDLIRLLAELASLTPERAVAVARSLIKVGVRPRPQGYRRERAGPDLCTICDLQVPFCWGCSCGFRICQACLEENRWGITCNNITWECPDCGGMRSF